MDVATRYFDENVANMQRGARDGMQHRLRHEPDGVDRDGEEDSRNSISPGGGIFKTENCGETWTAISDANITASLAMTVHTATRNAWSRDVVRLMPAVRLQCTCPRREREGVRSRSRRE